MIWYTCPWEKAVYLVLFPSPPGGPALLLPLHLLQESISAGVRVVLVATPSALYVLTGGPTLGELFARYTQVGKKNETKVGAPPHSRHLVVSIEIHTRGGQVCIP